MTIKLELQLSLKCALLLVSCRLSFAGTRGGNFQFEFKSQWKCAVRSWRTRFITVMEFDTFFDGFFDEQQPQAESDDDFNGFFDCITEEDDGLFDEQQPQAESDVDFNGFLDCITEEALESKKKSRQPGSHSFKVLQEKKINIEEIKKELTCLQMCCKLCCYLWLNVQIILFCRSQYILLPCYEDRRTWLARKMDDLEIGPGTFAYHVDVLSAERRKCCAKAWRFAYGVPEATHKRAMQNRSNHRQNNKKGKGKGTSAASFFIIWLLAFAQRVGDKLPFGDGPGSCTQIRLPFPNKKMVYNIYKNFERNENITKVDPIIHYSTAVLAWKEDPQAKHIKLENHKRFTR
jgi:hypothetical protein